MILVTHWNWNETETKIETKLEEKKSTLHTEEISKDFFKINCLRLWHNIEYFIVHIDPLYYILTIYLCKSVK